MTYKPVKPMSAKMEDTIIRGAGFRIVARPKDGGPIWQRRGVPYSQATALAVALRELKK